MRFTGAGGDTGDGYLPPGSLPFKLSPTRERRKLRGGEPFPWLANNWTVVGCVNGPQPYLRAPAQGYRQPQSGFVFVDILLHATLLVVAWPHSFRPRHCIRYEVHAVVERTRYINESINSV